MTNKERLEEIKVLRKSGMSLRQIGERFDLTGPRIRQILLPGYNPEPDPNATCFCCGIRHHASSNYPYHFCKSCFKKYFYRKSGHTIGGVDFARMIVRIRDKFTCQKCRKVWQEGQRHFDVHHLNDDDGSETFTIEDPKKGLEHLQTLCHRCHMNLPGSRERMGGWKYRNKLYYPEFSKRIDDALATYRKEKGVGLKKIAKKYGVTYTSLRRALINT